MSLPFSQENLFGPNIHSEAQRGHDRYTQPMQAITRGLGGGGPQEHVVSGNHGGSIMEPQMLGDACA